MMRRILSIYNFNSSCSAILLAILVICVVEFSFSIFLPPRFFSHEVDKILYEVKTQSMKADYILLGDSVGRQIVKKYENDNNFLMLATNQAIEMTGQYFLIKRFLKNNPAPKAVIFTGLPYFINNNLEQPFTENYILRTFNDLDELIDLLKVKKSLTQSLKSLTYKLLPSFKYRLHLQKIILGTTNASIYSGVGKEHKSVNSKCYSLGNIIKKYQGQKVSLYHFRKLIELLTNMGIHFYYIPVPTKQNGNTHIQFNNNYEGLFKLLETMQNDGMYLSFYRNSIGFPEYMYHDHVHFNEKGLAKVRPYIDSIIKEFISNFN